jgi:hypothetical protein
LNGVQDGKLGWIKQIWYIAAENQQKKYPHAHSHDVMLTPHVVED